MSRASVWFNVCRAVGAALLVCTLVLSVTTLVGAQALQGATLTVVSGTSSVVQANGTAAQPAPSGMMLAVGDRVATVGNGSTALITFFEGSEMELGPNTTILIREIVSSGNQVNVTIEDVLGDTFSRIKTFANPNSTYRVTNPGGTVVALVKGSTIRFLQMADGTSTVKVDCPPPAHPNELCQISVDGAVVAEGGPGFSREITVDPKGTIKEGGGDGEGGTNETPEENEENRKEDDDGGHYGIRETTPLIDQLLASRLDPSSAPFSATGSLLALGLIGWSVLGKRRRK